MDYYRPENVLLQQRYKQIKLTKTQEQITLVENLEKIKTNGYYNSIVIQKADAELLKTRNARKIIDYVRKNELDKVNIIYGANNRSQFINILPLSKQNQSITSTNRPIVIKLYTELDSSLKKRIFEKWLEGLKREFGIKKVSNITNTNTQISADYYSWEGEWIGSDGDSPTIVYIVGDKFKTPPFFGENGIRKGLIEFEKDIENTYRKTNGNIPDMYESLLLPIEKIPVSNNIFKKFVSDIYEETGYRKNKIAEPKESYAIANAIMNYCKKYTKKIDKVVFSKRYLKGAKEESLFSIPMKEWNQRYEVKAVILALMENIDYSNGAQFWDGYDLLLESKHYRKNVGIIVDEKHSTIFEDNNKDICKSCELISTGANPKYKSTAAHGRTIFWKTI